MSTTELQEICERGQLELMQTRYLEAATTLSLAEQRAWDDYDFDTLSRLYLPLQEARRQIRQRCLENVVLAMPSSAEELVEVPGKYRQGELLLVGQGSIQPGVEMRQLASDQKLYLEVLLGAGYLIEAEAKSMVVIAPLPETQLPAGQTRTVADLKNALPFGCLLIDQSELVEIETSRAGEYVMSLWERLHAPFLSIANAKPDPVKKMDAYRLTLRVDPGCELAHQFLADIARGLARGK
jgi:hypothetical protein